MDSYNIADNKGSNTELPKNVESPCRLITFRKSFIWGNDVNVRESSHFDAEVIIEEEAETTEFLKSNLIIKCSDSELERLSELLQHLPWALQMSISVLNTEKVVMKDYLSRISSHDEEIFVGDSYFRSTMNKVINISLGFIASEPEGKTALEIFKILSYIRSDDIPIEFLRRILKINNEPVQTAIKLLENYSLIEKSQNRKYFPRDGFINNLFGKKGSAIETEVISINPFLQKITRHNEKDTKNATIHKILDSRGFLDYKLTPYLYADDALKKKFKKIKAKFINGFYLQNLLTQERFQEAVNLSKFIRQEVNNEASWYNYACCLSKNGEDQESLIEFVALFSKMTFTKCPITEEHFLHGIIPLDSRPNYFNLGFHLLRLLQSKTEPFDSKERDVIKSYGNQLKFKQTVENIAAIVESLHKCTIQSYLVESKKNVIILEINPSCNSFEKKIRFSGCSFYPTINFPADLKELSFVETRFEDENSTELLNFNISRFIPLGIERLEIIYSNCTISLDVLENVEHFSAWHFCTLNIPEEPVRISPKSLVLVDVTIFQEGKKLAEIKVNDFVDFRRMKKLDLSANDSSSKFSINLSDDEVTAEEVKLQNTQVIDWTTAKWKIEKLEIQNASLLEKSQMSISELTSNSIVDLSSVPDSIQKMKLQNTPPLNLGDRPIQLLHLISLHLDEIAYPSACLSHFLGCTNLTFLQLTYKESVALQVNLFPDSITHIKINTKMPIQFQDTVIRRLQTLSLEEVDVEDIIPLIKRFVPKHVTINCSSREMEKEDLQQLMDSMSQYPIITALIAMQVKNAIRAECCYYYLKNNIQQAITKEEFHQSMGERDPNVKNVN